MRSENKYQILLRRAVNRKSERTSRRLAGLSLVSGVLRIGDPLSSEGPRIIGEVATSLDRARREFLVAVIEGIAVDYIDSVCEDESLPAAPLERLATVLSIALTTERPASARLLVRVRQALDRVMNEPSSTLEHRAERVASLLILAASIELDLPAARWIELGRSGEQYSLTTAIEGAMRTDIGRLGVAIFRSDLNADELQRCSDAIHLLIPAIRGRLGDSVLDGFLTSLARFDPQLTADLLRECQESYGLPITLPPDRSEDIRSSERHRACLMKLREIADHDEPLQRLYPSFEGALFTEFASCDAEDICTDDILCMVIGAIRLDQSIKVNAVYTQLCTLLTLKHGSFSHLESVLAPLSIAMDQYFDPSVTNRLAEWLMKMGGVDTSTHGLPHRALEIVKDLMIRTVLITDPDSGVIDAVLRFLFPDIQAIPRNLKFISGSQFVTQLLKRRCSMKDMTDAKKLRMIRGMLMSIPGYEGFLEWLAGQIDSLRDEDEDPNIIAKLYTGSSALRARVEQQRTEPSEVAEG